MNGIIGYRPGLRKDQQIVSRFLKSTEMAWLDLRKQMSQAIKHTQCRQTSCGHCQNYDSLLHRHCFRCPIAGRDSCIPPMARERHSKSGIPQPFRKRRCHQQNSGRRRDVPRHADDDPAKPHAKHLHKWLYRSAISLANKKNNSSPTTKLMLLSFQVATVTGVLQWADKLSKQVRKIWSHHITMWEWMLYWHWKAESLIPPAESLQITPDIPHICRRQF